MSPFQQVEDRHAGPRAIGILVPPGRQTIVILRPRALPWDLVLTRDAVSPAFREIFRDEAPRAVDAVHRALCAWAETGCGNVSLQETSHGELVRCTLGEFHFVACRRIPSRPYQPHLFLEAAQARQAVSDLKAVLRPSPGAIQEVYFNTRHFEK
jgi:hypothetical protein